MQITKCFNLSFAILSQSKPRSGHLLTASNFLVILLNSLIVSNATLHNEEEILRKDIRIGDTVKIERAGDVIPHVVEVDLKKRKVNSKKFIFPKKCPCGFETIKEFNKITKKFDAVRRCPDRGFDCDRGEYKFLRCQF